VKRRQGYGSRIVAEGIRVAKEKLGAKAIRIEAQTYARRLYEKLGFVQTTEEFLDDGIPHIGMLLEME
jgi:ElaA protein